MKQKYDSPTIAVILVMMRHRISIVSPYGYDDGNIYGNDSDVEQG